MSKAPSGFGDVANPFGEPDAAVEQYQPPAVPSWERQQPIVALDDADDEPFTAAHLAAVSQSSVPAVSKSNAPQRLAFTESVPAPAKDISGRIGPPPPSTGAGVPPQLPPSGNRYGGVPDTSLLLGANAPSSAPISSNINTSAGSGSGPPDEDPSTYPFYNIKRYRTYFNIDTNEVLQRIFRSVMLFFKGDFFDHVGGNPDLYGPWWIASTLVFVSAAAGNTASYIAYRRGSSSSMSPVPSPPTGSDSAVGWYYDVDKVGGSMGLFYGYVGVIGVLLYAVLRWFQAGISLAHVWCAYGYSLAVYIPMAALCVLPMEAVRWSLVMTATATSGIFLLLNFRAPIVNAAGAKAVPVLLVMVGLHALLGLSLKLYFFHYSSRNALP